MNYAFIFMTQNGNNVWWVLQNLIQNLLDGSNLNRKESKLRNAEVIGSQLSEQVILPVNNL